MKIRIFASLCAAVLIAFTLISALPVNGETEIYTDMIRLHVIANSDSEEDQTLKLSVRDGILSIIEDKEYESKEAAAADIEKMIPEIEKTAEKIIRENGYTYSVSAVLGEEDYPEREYDGFALPAGRYTSLRVIIGDGDGHNWWCVLFPPLCTAAASEREKTFISAGFTGEEYRIITETGKAKYKVKFKLLEILSDIFG